MLRKATLEKILYKIFINIQVFAIVSAEERGYNYKKQNGSMFERKIFLGRESAMRDFLERLRWKLQVFMRGRNGMDEMNRMLTYAVLCVYILAVLTRIWLLDVIALAGMIYIFYRMLSTKLYVRREENRRFMTKLETTRIKMGQRKDYKIFKCKGCGRNIRVPRGKGKIEVTCPMCGNKTIHRT